MERCPLLLDFPEILYPEDIERMGTAMTGALQRLEKGALEYDSDRLALTVVRFYRRGLVDPKKLERIAVLAARAAALQRREA